MSRLEDELKIALRREEPFPDLTDRVMARIAGSPEQITAVTKQEKSREKSDWRQKLVEFFQWPKMNWAMAGAMACLLVFTALGVYRYREHQRQKQLMLAEIAQGERAKEQVMLAMKIASAKLNVAQKKVLESSEK